ncbi:MAG: hypothetical protein GY796_17980 [Chloroflexi bacterium]|nr:hypothetical protein [Chloroflexota bacterium]
MVAKKPPPKHRDRLASLREPDSYLKELERSEEPEEPKQDRKRDRHKGSATVAARLPEELAAWVRSQAKGEGISVNAWLTKLIEEKHTGGKPP